MTISRACMQRHRHTLPSPSHSPSPAQQSKPIDSFSLSLRRPPTSTKPLVSSHISPSIPSSPPPPTPRRSIPDFSDRRRPSSPMTSLLFNYQCLGRGRSRSCSVAGE
ncbi:hypothetical protein Drorol1_Dr00016904 [Drosera rotundifolia]